MDKSYKYIYAFLCKNPNAIHILQKHINKIDWSLLSKNKNALPLLQQYPDKIHWSNLSLNPSAIDLLKENQDKIDWFNLSSNPAIFSIDYKYLKKTMRHISRRTHDGMLSSRSSPTYSRHIQLRYKR